MTRQSVTASWGALVVAAVVCAALPRPAPGAWIGGWKFRRQIQVPKFKVTRLPGPEIAVVDMPTAGAIKPDGSDILVATTAGVVMPHEVLMVGPGDRVRIAFALRPPSVRVYYVYFGNPKPPRTNKQLEIKRGVRLQTWRYPGGAFNTFQQVKDIFKRAKVFIGGDMLDRVFMGHNPFGPDARVASIFTAWMIVPKVGIYDFACSSQNASFLLIDDKLVASNGGGHGPQRIMRRMGQATLKAGLHKLTVYHVSSGGNPIVVAAWRQPGWKYLRMIPQGAYTRFYRATAGAIEEYGRPAAVDFLPDHAGETFMLNRYYQRFVFKAVSARKLRVRAWAWDFGDGQTADTEAVEHVYLTPGKYTVTLTGKTTTGKVSRTNRIYVSRPWARVTSNRMDSVRQYAKIVLDYDFEKFKSPADIAEAILLLERGRAYGGLIRAGDALVKRKTAPARKLLEVVPIYARNLVTVGRPDKAVAGLVTAAKMTDRPEVCAPLLVQAGQIALNEKSDANLAMKLYEQVRAKYEPVAAVPAIRQAKIGIGDVHRARGDYNKARQAYQAAGIRRPPRHRGKDPFVKGDFARHVEDYIRTRKLKDARTFLDQWANSFPLEKLEGYWSLLHVRWCRAKVLHAKAAREALILANVNPTSNYSAELLFLAADSLRRLAKPDQSREALKRIVNKYPESPFAAKAAEKLKGG